MSQRNKKVKEDTDSEIEEEEEESDVDDFRNTEEEDERMSCNSLTLSFGEFVDIDKYLRTPVKDRKKSNRLDNLIAENGIVLNECPLEISQVVSGQFLGGNFIVDLKARAQTAAYVKFLVYRKSDISKLLWNIHMYGYETDPHCIRSKIKKFMTQYNFYTAEYSKSVTNFSCDDCANTTVVQQQMEKVIHTITDRLLEIEKTISEIKTQQHQQQQPTKHYVQVERLDITTDINIIDDDIKGISDDRWLNDNCINGLIVKFMQHRFTSEYDHHLIRVFDSLSFSRPVQPLYDNSTLFSIIPFNANNNHWVLYLAKRTRDKETRLVGHQIFCHDSLGGKSPLPDSIKSFFKTGQVNHLSIFRQVDTINSGVYVLMLVEYLINNYSQLGEHTDIEHFFYDIDASAYDTKQYRERLVDIIRNGAVTSEYPCLSVAMENDGYSFDCGSSDHETTTTTTTPKGKKQVSNLSPLLIPAQL
ncbi:hypothetical protein PPL_03905 [Heterostelium album PN500]|uniref:Ubiquitin-like protease family profile domain-containing protein n=1 Tax=Heterostelium pallidum (strain ATCC 26659 / Pp 5 / PN500) TaxID=670386 RepID=D3B5G7_HETP5|nr:hypothetical protein PPL_03905 [Heterostelium album PN500]EFA83115.1 hypothetical protein PPL_03905 [Heterostelium album PN500]|eukprot:XP_020435232.1 hypothetical protein PPL_03905 [Heterostelium album PN500]